MATSVHGPYKHGRRWRVLVRSDGAQSAVSFESEAEANKFRDAAERQASGVTLALAIDRYEMSLRERGLRKNTWQTTIIRMRQVFAKNLGKAPAEISPFVAKRIYQQMTSELSVDSHRNRLSEAKAFFKWCIKEGLVKRNPFDAVEPVGRRKRGKPQLSIDEARKLTALCMERAADGEHGAMAVLLCLYLGLRSTEATDRVARDFDDGCSVLWIRGAKTAAGERRVEIPDALRGLLAGFLAGKHSKEHVLPLDRFTLRRELRRYCADAKVQTVCVHSLRGLHATLATSAGATSHLVSQALGHTSEAMTARHYTDARATEQATTTRVLRVLHGDPK
jgi:integrase